jgi:nucleoside-diphosphate-sugar epimerase
MIAVIAGGHGKVALRLTRRLHERGDRVLSLIRNPAHAGDVEAAGGEPVVCDLEHAEEDEVVRAVENADAVVFAAGAGPGSGPERKWTIDYGGAVKLMAAAEANGIARYVMLSSRGADPDAPGDDTFAVYLRAKGEADAALRSSRLDHTIVRPGWLTDDPGTGRITAGHHVDDGKISRDDVAAVLGHTLHDPALAGTTFEVIAGDARIEEALAACRRRSAEQRS